MFSKKLNSLFLSSALLIAACGGGGGDTGSGGGTDVGIPGIGFPDDNNRSPDDKFSPRPGDGQTPPPDNDQPPPPPKEDTLPLTPIVGVKPWQPLLPPANGNPPNQFSFLVFADAHADYDPKGSRMELNPSEYSSAGNDLDAARFKTFLEKISNYFPKNSQAFALLLGDTAAHSSTRYRDDNLIAAMSDFKTELGDKLNFPFLHVHGNNDSMEEHYGRFNESNYSYVPGKAKWLGASGGVSPYLSNAMQCGPLATFPCIAAETKKGYFTAYLQHGLKLIALDSVMFTGKAAGNYTFDEANEQFGWFERQLKASQDANENVILAMHIAPSSGAWGVKFKHATNPALDINNTVSKFENIVADRPGVVIAMFTGHSHNDNTYTYDIEISGKKPYQYIPRINVIGLSTSHANAAGFREIKMIKDENNKWAVQNTLTYVFQPGDVEQTDANLQMTMLYNYNATYCPKKAAQANMTLAKCMYPRESGTPSYDDFETGKNPNCIKYSGGNTCMKENEPPPVL